MKFPFGFKLASSLKNARNPQYANLSVGLNVLALDTGLNAFVY